MSSLQQCQAGRPGEVGISLNRPATDNYASVREPGDDRSDSPRPPLVYRGVRRRQSGLAIDTVANGEKDDLLALRARDDVHAVTLVRFQIELSPHTYRSLRHLEQLKKRL